MSTFQLLDVFMDDPAWTPQSAARLAEALSTHEPCQTPGMKR
jgi:hypothetical protein